MSKVKRCLYNGVELAVLPEWGQDKYPNVCIMQAGVIEGAIYMVRLPYQAVPVPTNDGSIMYETPCYELFTAFGGREWEFGNEYTEPRTVYLYRPESDGENPALHIIWSNFDIYDGEGNRYYEKSDDPVPIYEYFDLRSWLTGYALGLAGKRLPFGIATEREPVGYLYAHIAKEDETPTHTINGVGYVGAVLPKLLEIPEGYEYMEIETSVSLDEFWLIAQTTISIRLNDRYQYPEDGNYLIYKVADGVWVTDGKVHSYKQGQTFGSDAYGGILWSNYNILTEDGKVYLEKFDPVPVNE